MSKRKTIQLAICLTLAIVSTSWSGSLPPLATKPEDLGKAISRTMSALATSRPEKRNTVRILFYGQSIVAQSWTHGIAKRLRKKYPHAKIEYKNPAIGGFQADRLVRTSESDMYPYYPDLVIFHDYFGFCKHKAQFEKMIATLRQKTTAEILLTTHHYSHKGNKWVQQRYDQESQIIRDLASKYDCELVDIRKEWKHYLDSNKMSMNHLLRDIVHLNGRGCKLMEDLVWRHLVYNESYPTPHAKWISAIPVNKVITKPFSIKFKGNRVDLIARSTGGGQARILIDGKAPSTFPGSYVMGRTSKQPGRGTWCPAIIYVGSKTLPIPEKWTLTVTGITKDGKKSHYNRAGLKYNFKVVGSKTGPDGIGNSDETFVSKSGRVVIQPSDFGVGRQCKVGDKVTWSVNVLARDAYEPNTQKRTMAKFIGNTSHTLTIIPDGEIDLKEIIVYEPPLKADEALELDKK